MRDKIHLYKNTIFDSQEEVFFAMWCEQLKQAGYINQWRKAKDAIPLTEGLKIKYKKIIQLKTKTKTIVKDQILLRPSEYTCDFEILWTNEGKELFVKVEDNNYNPEKIFFNRFINYPTYVEIKPAFNMENMSRLFINNQKFIWEFKRVFINLIEPEELFRKTFMPEEAKEYFIYKKNVKNKKKGEWKVDWIPKTLKDFLKNNKNEN